MRITPTQYQAACHIAARVYAGELTKKAGAQHLADENGLNITTAGDFIYDYKQMMNGKLFQRAMSAPAIEYFLKEIYKKHGAAALENSIGAVLLHIEYFEKHYKISMHKMRGVVEEIEKYKISTLELDAHLAEFDASVQRSLGQSSAERIFRLNSSSDTPRKIRTYVEVFVRNPDVVAEVLFRAAGKCQGCGANAPFFRKKDGTPYLEVHHKVRLAEGGKDNIQNAIALCPNCHRQRHFGDSYS